MTLVDSSVWIGYLRGDITPQTQKLHELLASERLVTGDLILVEVLQGIARDREFNRTKQMLMAVDVLPLCGELIAIQAAKNFRTLRSRGITVRKTVDTVIATWCIENACRLLHDDPDFDAFTVHLGLRVA